MERGYLSYEEFARLAETRLAQHSLNHIETDLDTLRNKLCQGKLSCVNVIRTILSQPSLSQPSKFLMHDYSQAVPKNEERSGYDALDNMIIACVDIM